MSKVYSFQLIQNESGAVILYEGTHSTILSLRQLLQLRFRSSHLSGFNQSKMEQFYAGLSDPIARQEIDWGFQPGDQVVKQYLDQVVIINNGCVQIVSPSSGIRFIIDLEDSKRLGRRISLNMTIEQQLEAADVHIGTLFSTTIDRLNGIEQ